MSLLSERPAINARSVADVALLHRLECKACPLNNIPKGGKLEPTGSDAPEVYLLGEAPGKNEALEREQFIGESGQILRPLIPKKYRDKVRFNNVVRSWPGQGNPTPDLAPIEACRPSIVRDIELTKPKAIFGFGNIPLDWVSGFNGITLWRGRRMPVRVGKHTCWYYPMLHPSYLLRQRRGRDKSIKSGEEFMFELDLKKAFAELPDLPPPKVHTPADVQFGVEIIMEGGSKGLAKVQEALAWAAGQPVIGVDYETNGIRPYHANSKILTAAVATGERAIAFPFEHPEALWTPDELVSVRQLWTQFLRKARGVKAVHNLAFELEWTGASFGPEHVRSGRWGDTASQACILDERRGKQRPGPFSLEFLVQQYFGINLKKLAGVNRSSLEDTPLEAVLRYNAPDAKYHALLFEAQRDRIEAEGLYEAYELALRSVPTVVLTQLKGIPIDQVEVKRLQIKYEGAIEKVEAPIAELPVVKEFNRLKGRKFNPLSNPDVLYVLKDMLHRGEVSVVDKYTKKEKYSADVDVLEKIDIPFAKLLVELRHYTKRKSTYVDPLDAGYEETVIYADGLSHGQFNTIFAATGRLSAEGPNWQNFPKRDNDAKEVRKQIVSPPGCVVLAFDYAQLEARVIALFTKDARFCKALWERYDVHMEWAERLAHAYPARVGGKKFLADKKVMKAFRTDVKNQFTFPLFFGATLPSASGYLHIPEEILAPLYDEFWDQFAGVKTWQSQQVEFYRRNGYVECLTGRRRRGPLSTNQILNSPVQGTAAALVLDAMSRLSEEGNPDLQPEINIHDDLTFLRVPENRVDQVAEQIVQKMINLPFSWAKYVPIAVEMSVGVNWLEMQEVASFSSDDWGYNG